MYEMEKAMCEAIARHTPFSADEIFTEWLSFKSFDLILRAVEFAALFGFSLRSATNVLIVNLLEIERPDAKRE